MKDRILGFVSCLAIGVAALPTALQAQNHDIAKRGQAMQECDVEGWLGYGSYEICVEERYQELLNQPPESDDPEYWGNSYGCSAGSRICG